MVDQLSPFNRPSLPLESVSSPQRLEAMLASGLPRTAQVVQVAPQRQANPNAASTNTMTATTSSQVTTGSAVILPPGPSGTPSALTSTSSTQHQTGTAAPLPTTSTATPPPTAPTTTSTSATATANLSATVAPQASAATGQADVFIIRVRLEGRLYELLTNKPLDLGSRVQLSRGSDNQIALQLLPTTSAQASSQSAPRSPSQALTGTPTPAQTSSRESSQQPLPVASHTAMKESPRPLIQNAANPTQQPLNPQATNRGAPTVTSQYSQTSPPTRPADQAAPRPPTTTNSANTANTTSSRQSTPDNRAVERLAIPNIKPELAARIAPGERLSAIVISATAANSPAAISQPNITKNLSSALTQSPTLSTTSTMRASDSGSYQIRIDVQQGQKIDISSPRSLPPGTPVQLVRDNQGQLWVELPTPNTRALEQALRKHLPQQQPPSALLNLLSSSQASGQLQHAKPLLFSLFQILLGRSLTSPLQTDAASVKQQVQNSGTLMESKLAQGSSQSNTQSINMDHKAILLKITQQLSPANNQKELPAALSERINLLTQQALSRVLINQITSIGAQAQETGSEQNRTLVLDIPITWQGRTENLQLKIQRDERGQDEETGSTVYRWQVRLNFEVEENRILEAELTLEADQISILWSGDKALRNRLEAQLDQLQQRLESIGLKVKTLGVRELLPETGQTPKPPRNQLIDIKT